MNDASRFATGSAKTLLAEECTEGSNPLDDGDVRAVVASASAKTITGWAAGSPFKRGYTDEEARALLAQLEGVIDRGLSVFLEVGRALMEIQRNGLHQLSHETFEDYCRDRFGFERAHAYRLMDSVKVVDVLPPTGDVPTSERQARELVPLLKRPKLLREAWAQALETAGEGRLTAAHVRGAVDAFRKKRIVSEPAAGTNYDEVFQTTRMLAKLGTFEYRFESGFKVPPSKARKELAAVEGAIVYLTELRDELERRSR